MGESRPRVHRGAQQRPGGEARLESTIFQELYQQYNIYDTMSMNLAYDHQVMALLTLYRTRADGVFTDEEAFYLRALAGTSTMPITPCPHRGPAKRTGPRLWRSWSRSTT